jgi:hypothetical protein
MCCSYQISSYVNLWLTPIYGLTAMQRHYAILQAIALEQEEESLLEATDTTLPDSKGIMR